MSSSSYPIKFRIPDDEIPTRPAQREDPPYVPRTWDFSSIPGAYEEDQDSVASSPVVASPPIVSSPPRVSSPPAVLSPPVLSSPVKPISQNMALARNAERRLVIAIDYGTTYTGIAWADPKTYTADLEDIEVVIDWGGGMDNAGKVPSVISYTLNGDDSILQWGSSITPDAVTMLHTKLELDNQESKLDELELILQVLDGMEDLSFNKVVDAKGYPQYTWKTPEDIVGDYLGRMFVSLQKEIPSLMALQVPIDLVLTVPVTWSYRAKNSTLHAVQRAGFNLQNFPNLRDIVMVTEPEAAAIYTARYLKDKERVQFLKIGECFVLCDAGGGTVDIVAYKVVRLEPMLELERVTLPTGAKCGSIYIDRNFQKWLLGVIGRQYYRSLDPKNAGQKIGAHSTESKEMRALMLAFDGHKKDFPNQGPVMHLDLPKPLDNLNIGDKVNGGELTITKEEMQSFFDPCVDQIIELIQSQILNVEKLGNRVKNIFLAGGFSESKYLQEQLGYSMKLRKITLRRPATSWTAVVQGAVILGIEKLDHKNLTVLKTLDKNYGIILNSGISQPNSGNIGHYTDLVTNRVIAEGQLTWLIKRGDLLLSDTRKEVDENFTLSFRSDDNKVFTLPIYEYPDDDRPERYATAQSELAPVGALTCDFSNYELEDFKRSQNSRNGKIYYTAHCTCRAVLTSTSLIFSIIWDDRQLCSIDLMKAEMKVPPSGTGRIARNTSHVSSSASSHTASVRS